MNDLKIGDIVSHFKRDLLSNEELMKNNKMYLYVILQEGIHTETETPHFVYQALYGNKDIWIRPKDMFLEKVDKSKYPNTKQEYRFEKFNCLTILDLNNKVGEWIAYKKDNVHILHGRIIPHKYPSFKTNHVCVRRKNGVIDYVFDGEILGFTQKPTKTNKNPIINPVTIYKI